MGAQGKGENYLDNPGELFPELTEICTSGQEF